MSPGSFPPSVCFKTRTISTRSAIDRAISSGILQKNLLFVSLTINWWTYKSIFVYLSELGFWSLLTQVTDFFSYEHFYVIYCKFWELDKDHDLFIDREDLARHNDHGRILIITIIITIINLVIARFFSSEHAYDWTYLLRSRDKRQRSERGKNVLHRVRLVPSQWRGEPL